MALQATNIVNLERYPFLAPENSKWSELLPHLRSRFEASGVCILEDFIRPELLPQFIREAEELAPLAYHNTLTGNAYLDEPSANLPDDHVRRLTETTSLGAVAYDQIPRSTLLRTVYEWPELTRLIQVIVNRGPVYHYACPMGGINISVMRDNDYLRWHFDQSEFVVSIPVQDAEQGGKFEFVHNLRRSGDECYEDVAAVLKGDRSRVQILNTPPGSLVLFQGMNTLHRVTTIHGKKDRLIALLGYADRPDVDSSDYLKQIRYGRTKVLSQ